MRFTWITWAISNKQIEERSKESRFSLGIDQLLVFVCKPKTIQTDLCVYVEEISTMAGLVSYHFIFDD